jgi:hypothetical protein
VSPDPEKVTPEEAGAEPQPLPPDLSTKPWKPGDEGATPEERGKDREKRDRE